MKNYRERGDSLKNILFAQNKKLDKSADRSDIHPTDQEAMTWALHDIAEARRNPVFREEVFCKAYGAPITGGQIRVEPNTRVTQPHLLRRIDHFVQQSAPIDLLR